MKRILFFGIAFVFLLLLYKDPFSQRTLIPNFEPHPDTFYYIVPPLNLIKGEGFYLSREGRIFRSGVAPLYSLAFLPFLLINPDPRMVYYANVLLALASMSLFWLILKKVTKNVWIISFVLFLYITNYFLLWMPTLAMAENLILPLYLLAIYLLLRKSSFLNFTFLGALSLFIFATKGVSIPASVSILILSIFKIFSSYKNNFSRLKAFLCLSGAFSSLLLLYSLFLFFMGNFNIFSSLFSFLPLVSTNSAPSDFIDVKYAPPPGGFSYGYIKTNLPLYLGSLIGNPEKFLWERISLIPKYIAIAGIIGILLGFTNKNYRFFSAILAVFICISIIFLSTFYAFDARYIYIVIPSLLFGFLILTLILSNFFSKRKKTFLFKIIFVVFFVFYLFTNIIRLKSLVRVNFKYSETPWSYISILKLNEYFTKEKIIKDKKPVVISPLPPYLIDFYSNGNYTLLPLSYEQEFRKSKEIVWGPNDYSDLPLLYNKYLLEGYDVYVAKYGLGIESYNNRDFNIIMNTFNTQLVFAGCFDQCNIYKIILK